MRCTTHSIFMLFCLLFATATRGQNVVLEAKVFLQGPYQPSTMDDDLRTANLIPLVEPYTALGYTHVGGGGGEQIDPAVLGITGNDAIVDWVVAELRQAGNPSNILASRSALVQRDGDVVDVNGSCPVRFEGLNPGNYHVAIRHRNHLGVMTQGVVNLQADPMNCLPAVAIIDDVYVRDNQPDPSDVEFYDRWGNGYTRGELEFMLISSVRSCDAGYFRLLFDGNLTADQETVVCKVFEDIANIIIPRDADLEIIIDVTESVFTNPTVLATGTPVLDISECGITNSVIEKILIGGDPLFLGMAHGILDINKAFENNWFTDLINTPTTADNTKYHLYTVILHEALHILGIGARIMPDGSPLSGVYSQYDRLLFSEDNGGEFLISPDAANTSCCDAYLFSGNTNSLRTGDCNNLFIRSNNTNIVPVDGNLSSGVGNLLSHFNIDCSTSNELFVMHPNLSQIGLNTSGSYPIRDEITCSELEVLSLLGYNIDNSTVSCSNIPSVCNVIAVDDIVQLTPNDLSTTITLPITQILSNDIASSTVQFTFDANVQGLTITQVGGDLIIDLLEGGTHVINYEISDCGLCDEGIIEIIIPSCANAICQGCNILASGDFECFSSRNDFRLQTTGSINLDEGYLFGSPNFSSTLEPWSNENFPRPIFRSNFVAGCVTTQSLEDDNSVGLVSHNTIQGDNFSSGIVLAMSEEIFPGDQVVVSMLAEALSGIGQTNPQTVSCDPNIEITVHVSFLTDQFTSTPPISNQVIQVYNIPEWSGFQANITANTQILTTGNATGPFSPTSPVIITNTSSNTWRYLLLSVSLDNLINNTHTSGIVAIDNIEIIKQKQINITPTIYPSNSCTGGRVTVQYEIENPHCSPSGDLNLSLNVPTDLTLLSVGTFSGGSSSMTINEIPPYGTVTVTAVLQVNSTAMAGDIIDDIELSVTPTSCYQANTASTQLNIVDNPLGGITKTVTNSGNVYDVTITIDNPTANPILDVSLEDGIPDGFTITNNPDGFALTPTMSSTSLALQIAMLDPFTTEMFTYQMTATSPFCEFERCAIVEIIDSGCGSEIACVTFTGSNPPVASADFSTATSCTPISANFTSNSDDPTWTHEWEFGDAAMGTSTLANPSYTYSSAGTYYVTHTITDACNESVTKEEMITIHCNPGFDCNCLASSTYVGSPLGGTTNISTTAVSSFYSNTGLCLQFGGRIIINRNTVISGGDMVFEAGAEIVIPSGKELTIINANLYSCGNHLWNGIVVENGGTITLGGNTITDADVAIELNQTSNFNIQSTIFDRNRTGILVLGTPNKIAFTNNVFDASALLNNGLEGLVGVRVENAFFPIGNGSTAISEPNTFRRLHYGVIAKNNSSVWVIDAIMENLNYNTTSRLITGSDNNGLGVLAHHSDIHVIQSSFTDLHEAIRANDSRIFAYDNTLTNVDQGIEVVNLLHFQRLEILDNVMDVSAMGIHLENIVASSKNRIEGNTINIDWFGHQVEAGNTTPSSGTSTVPRGIFVDIFDDNSGLNNNLKIEDNIFNMQLESASSIDPDVRAIELVACNGVNIVNNETNGIPDPITGSGLSRGLFLTACSELLVSENVIGGAHPPSIPIQVENCDNVAYCCNEFDATFFGFEFIGMCAPSYIYNNDIGEAIVGLHCEPGTILGEQAIFNASGTSIHHSGNQFTAGYTYYSFMARHQGTPTEVFASQIYLSDAMPITVHPPNFVVQSTLPAPPACNLIGACVDVDAGAGDITYVDLTVASAGGTTARTTTGFESDMLNWQAGKYLIRKLQANPQLLGKYPSIDAFYVAQKDMVRLLEVERSMEIVLDDQVATVAAIQQEIMQLNNELAHLGQDYLAAEDENRRSAIQASIQQITTTIELKRQEQIALEETNYQLVNNHLVVAHQYNAGWSSSNSFAQNEQFIYSIYLNYLLHPEQELTGEQINRLYAIANECHEIGGKSVAWARVLYYILVGQADFKVCIDYSDLWND